MWMLLIISIFILNEIPRIMLLKKFLSIDTQSNIWLINVLFILSSALLLIYYSKKRALSIRINFIIFLIEGIIFANTLFGNISIDSFILFVISYMIPLVFISINIDNIDEIVKLFLKLLNVMIILLTIYGIIDYFTQGSLQLFIADNFAYGEFQLLIYDEHGYIYRMYSFLGHPLANANLYLIFFSLNKIYNKYYKTFYNDYILLIITIIGLILSGSRAALILACFLFVFCSGVKRHKWAYYALLAVSLGILFNTSLFQNNLLKRFEYGVKNDDISSGRNTVLKEIIALGVKPNLIISEGSGYSREITQNAMTGAENFEYPPIMLAYDYGIIEASLIYFIIFIYPLIIFIKNHNYYIFFNYLALFLYANSNNGLANLGGEAMAIFCFIVMLLVNISKGISNDLFNSDA